MSAPGGELSKRAALSQLRRKMMHLNDGIGVGYWNKADAVRQARLEEARTGRIYAVVMESTPRQTHALWWVRVVGTEAA